LGSYCGNGFIDCDGYLERLISWLFVVELVTKSDTNLLWVEIHAVHLKSGTSNFDRGIWYQRTKNNTDKKFHGDEREL
jgi:hypothetical protein